MAMPATMADQGNVRQIRLNILTRMHKDYCNDFTHGILANTHARKQEHPTIGGQNMQTQYLRVLFFSPLRFIKKIVFFKSSFQKFNCVTTL